MKTIRYAFWAIIALCLVLVGLANTGDATVRAMPLALADLLGISPDVTVPMYVVMFLGVGAGLLIGFVWEWLREHKLRAQARKTSRELVSLRREVEKLRAENARGDGDDVLALLDKAG